MSNQRVKVLLVSKDLFPKEEALKLAEKLFEITSVKYIPISVPSLPEIIKSVEL